MASLLAPPAYMLHLLLAHLTPWLDPAQQAKAPDESLRLALMRMAMLRARHVQRGQMLVPALLLYQALGSLIAITDCCN